MNERQGLPEKKERYALDNSYYCSTLFNTIKGLLENKGRLYYALDNRVYNTIKGLPENKGRLYYALDNRVYCSKLFNTIKGLPENKGRLLYAPDSSYYCSALFNTVKGLPENKGRYALNSYYSRTLFNTIKGLPEKKGRYALDNSYFCSTLFNTINTPFFVFVIWISLMVDGPQRAKLPIPPMNTTTLPSCLWSHEGSSHLSSVLVLRCFYIAMQVQHSLHLVNQHTHWLNSTYPRSQTFRHV